MKHSIFLTLLTTVSLATFSSPNFASSAADSCKTAASLAEKDPKAALEEAKWCVELLEQEMQKLSANLFPDKINGFTGGELSQQKAMGFNMSERTYSKGSESIKVSLNTGSAGGFNMAALAQFGAMAGGQKIRVNGVTGVVMPEQGAVMISFALANGGTLMLESSSASREKVIEFAEAFPLAQFNAN